MTVESVRPRAVVKAIKSETPTLLSVKLEVPREVALRFERPGQYIVLHPKSGDKPVFMAIASLPGDPILELLVGPAAQEKLQLTQGASIEVDPPQGKGYPIEMARGKDLVLFAVGSGMSAIRSVLEYVKKNRDDFGHVYLYAGAHSKADHAYSSDDDAWRSSRMTVRRTNSKPWVQDVFRSDSIAVDGAVAFVCGMKDMVAAVTEALVSAGMPKENVRQNF